MSENLSLRVMTAFADNFLDGEREGGMVTMRTKDLLEAIGDSVVIALENSVSKL